MHIIVRPFSHAFYVPTKVNTHYSATKIGASVRNNFFTLAITYDRVVANLYCDEPTTEDFATRERKRKKSTSFIIS